MRERESLINETIHGISERNIPAASSAFYMRTFSIHCSQLTLVSLVQHVNKRKPTYSASAMISIYSSCSLDIAVVEGWSACWH